jgi:hypothetical protein
VTNPVPGYAVTTPYGRRGTYWSCDQDSSGQGIHTGADYAAPAGTQVVAARGGRVVYCSHGSAFGYHQLEVLPGDGTRDFYAHLQNRAVGDGAQVETGQRLGQVGSEGNATGPHLHFERHSVASGGWSCSVVRDPAPSINYQPPGSDDDNVLNQDDKDWIKKQIANSQQAVLDRLNALVGDVVKNPTQDDDENTVMAKTALSMLLERTD